MSLDSLLLILKTLFLTILFSVAVVSISTVICTYLSQYSKN